MKLNKIFCNLGVHIWKNEYEKIDWLDIEKFASRGSISNGYWHAPSGNNSIYQDDGKLKLYYQRINTRTNSVGEISQLPEGFVEYEKNNYQADNIFKKVRICKFCNIKKNLVYSGIGDAWKKCELSKMDIRDIKLENLLK